jgi:hypothetical protein
MGVPESRIRDPQGHSRLLLPEKNQASTRRPASLSFTDCDKRRSEFPCLLEN